MINTNNRITLDETSHSNLSPRLNTQQYNKKREYENNHNNSNNNSSSPSSPVLLSYHNLESGAPQPTKKLKDSFSNSERKSIDMNNLLINNSKDSSPIPSPNGNIPLNNLLNQPNNDQHDSPRSNSNSKESSTSLFSLLSKSNEEKSEFDIPKNFITKQNSIISSNLRKSIDDKSSSTSPMTSPTTTPVNSLLSHQNNNNNSNSNNVNSNNTSSSSSISLPIEGGDSISISRKDLHSLQQELQDLRHKLAASAVTLVSQPLGAPTNIPPPPPQQTQPSNSTIVGNSPRGNTPANTMATPKTPTTAPGNPYMQQPSPPPLSPRINQYIHECVASELGRFMNEFQVNYNEQARRIDSTLKYITDFRSKYDNFFLAVEERMHYMMLIIGEMDNKEMSGSVNNNNNANNGGNMKGGGSSGNASVGKINEAASAASPHLGSKVIVQQRLQKRIEEQAAAQSQQQQAQQQQQQLTPQLSPTGKPPTPHLPPHLYQQAQQQAAAHQQQQQQQQQYEQQPPYDRYYHPSMHPYQYPPPYSHQPSNY
ncbi:hypothetical protein PPL_03161 [Heterostelium album PN500]|uniref:Uncharacterized protein n=1 Tax=Heterostelium pallidum (strain ATCC 26659 / Pp 5 / PN500) TaxID=670386 RepID=D3B440_HETP5|nr:hypothetical protein PPL_03161 [Heterostelium album PN500]EFA84088.1 hypothetical protein PPL_03161 [Heterostelium album PN500]|eukprot:XP_020436205.1 hypothetical protein PPL_03161 [Heterostelium album PN500]